MNLEYYGIHAEWFYRLIEADELTEYWPHTHAAIKHLRNFPESRSLAEDHKKTAFCAAVDIPPEDVELFKRSVRGTLQGFDWICRSSASWPG